MRNWFYSIQTNFWIFFVQWQFAIVVGDDGGSIHLISECTFAALNKYMERFVFEFQKKKINRFRPSAYTVRGSISYSFFLLSLFPLSFGRSNSKFCISFQFIFIEVMQIPWIEFLNMQRFAWECELRWSINERMHKILCILHRISSVDKCIVNCDVGKSAKGTEQNHT